MPGYKTHLAGGIIIFTALLSIPFFLVAGQSSIDIKLVFWLLLCTLAGALFPDIDIKSKGQFYFSRLMALFIVGAIILQNWYLLSALSILLLFPLLVNHRGITHQVWFLLLAPLSLPVMVALLNSKLVAPAFLGSLFFIAGAISHVFLDFGPRNFMRRGFFGWPKYKKKRWRK